jgi:hypothetical protein
VFRDKGVNMSGHIFRSQAFTGGSIPSLLETTNIIPYFMYRVLNFLYILKNFRADQAVEN